MLTQPAVYAELCGSDRSSLEDVSSETDSPSSYINSTSHLAKRERDEETLLPCLYGVPLFTVHLPPRSAIVYLDKKILMFAVFCIAVAVCIIDRRRK